MGGHRDTVGHSGIICFVLWLYYLSWWLQMRIEITFVIIGNHNNPGRMEKKRDSWNSPTSWCFVCLPSIKFAWKMSPEWNVMCIHVYKYSAKYVCIYACLYMYIRTHIHTKHQTPTHLHMCGRQTGRQADRQTGRQGDRQTGSHACMHAYIHNNT